MTRRDARLQYLRHADDPRHFDLTAVCLLVGVGGFAGLLMALVVRALMGGWW
jgi:hypothetical protein